jgi:protein Jumonji
MKYIERIRREAEPFGICKIIPPSSFKPECNVDDDMRFTAYNQVRQLWLCCHRTNTLAAL